MAKKKRTPEQQEKFNKKLFGWFMALVLLVCAVVGVVKGFKSVGDIGIGDLDAFKMLKESYDPISVTRNAGLTGKVLNMDDATHVASILTASDVDYYTAGSFDSDKWQSSCPATATFDLSDVYCGVFVKGAIGGTVRAMAIDTYKDGKYVITILEYINLHQYVQSETMQDMLPAYAWVTSQSIVHQTDGIISIDESKIIAYNELGQAKSDVITAVLNSGENKITEYSIKRFVSTINELATKTNTHISLGDENITFAI